MVASIRQCGHEDVFDIQVARTENFIVGGLVSHNTRWHDDDLAGWLLEEHNHEGWEVLNLPAIDDSGRALWPEQYDIEALEKIKRAIGPRDWQALYQQEPTAESGNYFLLDWLHEYTHHPPLDILKTYIGSDYAVTSNGGDYTVHVVVGIDHSVQRFLASLLSH